MLRAFNKPHAMLRYAIAMLCYALRFLQALWYGMVCYASYAMLCYAMLCYASRFLQLTHDSPWLTHVFSTFALATRFYVFLKNVSRS